MKPGRIVVLLTGILLLFVHGPSSADTGSSPDLDAATRTKCLAILREAVLVDEFWPSMHAAEALTLAGYGGEVRPLLEPKLATEKDDQHRCGLARELVRAGDRSKAAVMLDILGGEDGYAHVHACESLYKVNEIGDGRLMREALRQGEDPRKALMAAAALGRRGDGEGLAFVRARLGDADPDVARIAAWIVARVGDVRDIPALQAGAARFTDPLPRAYFEHALAALGDEAGKAALLRNLGDADAGLRTSAAVFAGEAGMVEACEALVGLLDDETVDVRVRAAQSLLVLGQQAVKGGKRLLLDSRVVETTQGVELKLGTVVKDTHNPLFVEDKPWEVRFDNLYANVVQEEAKYRLWYSPFIMDEATSNTPVSERAATLYRPKKREMGVCYAVSEDGIVWQKPELGVVAFDGTAANNIVMRRVHGSGVFLDRHASDAKERYKAFTREGIATSADGLRWSSVTPCPEIDAAGDTHNNALWVAERNAYVGHYAPVARRTTCCGLDGESGFSAMDEGRRGAAWGCDPTDLCDAGVPLRQRVSRTRHGLQHPRRRGGLRAGMESPTPSTGAASVPAPRSSRAAPWAASIATASMAPPIPSSSTTKSASITAAATAPIRPGVPADWAWPTSARTDSPA